MDFEQTPITGNSGGSDTPSNGAAVQPSSAPSTSQVPVTAQQPSASQPQSAPAQPMVSNAPAQNQDDHADHPAVKRASLLRSVAETLAGGPRYTEKIDDSGNRVYERVPLSRKDIGMAIALSAVTGALSGLGEHGPSAPAEAAAKGFAATSAQRKKQITDQDDQANKDFARRAAVAESNLRMLGNAIQLGRLKREDHDAMVAAYADTLKDWKENAPDLIKAEHVPEQEAKDLNKWHMADYLRIPDGSVPRIGPDGRPVYMDLSGRIVPEGTQGAYQVYDNTYALIDKTAKAPLKASDGQPAQWVKDAVSWGLPGYPPSLLKALSTAEVSAASAARAQHQVVMLNALQSEIDSFAKSFGTNKDGSSKVASVDLRDALQKDPSLLKAIQQFQRHSGISTQPDQQLAAMQKDQQTAPFAGRIIALFGPDNLEQFKSNRETREAAQKSGAEARARGDEEVRTQKNLIPVKAETAGAEAKAKAAASSVSAKNEDGSWNMSSIPVALVEGNMDPSQLSKRSQDYNSKIQQANEYSQQKYGHPFDLAKAQSDYKYATNPSTQNTLKYLNSLTGSDNKSGNLGALVSLSNQISRTEFPALNDAVAWAKIQTGNRQMASYHTAVVEVADQVAKILQGGGSGSGTSDAKLKQAAELFQKGFTKDQIADVAGTLRTLLANRKTELVGDNRYLLKQFGSSAPSQLDTPPARATMKVPGSDGKLHWSDGKNDLGVVQQ